MFDARHHPTGVYANTTYTRRGECAGGYVYVEVLFIQIIGTMELARRVKTGWRFTYRTKAMSLGGFFSVLSIFLSFSRYLYFFILLSHHRRLKSKHEPIYRTHAPRNTPTERPHHGSLKFYNYYYSIFIIMLILNYINSNTKRGNGRGNTKV